jgi:DNA-3-methyladenine glycosylase
MSTSRRAATLPVAFFDRDVATVARELLGLMVVSIVGGERVSGRIVETEAYLGRDDPASHGYRDRRNERNAALFGPPGTWYVYRSYGVHWCTNLVCGPEGSAGAVLLRALEPVEGWETMRRRRGAVDDRDLCSGPGKLCEALGITRALDGALMPRSSIVVIPTSGMALPSIVATPRIGITKAADWPLRFCVEGSLYVSGRRNRSPVERRVRREVS